jgi:hypothetical protein
MKGTAKLGSGLKSYKTWRYQLTCHIILTCTVFNCLFKLEEWNCVLSLVMFRRSRCSSVSIVTRLRDGRRGFDSSQARGLFSLPLCPDRLWGPPSLVSVGYWGLFSLGRETDHPLLPSAEAKNVWSYTSTSPYFLMTSPMEVRYGL